MVEEIFSGYKTPQSDPKQQKLLECILTKSGKSYLGKVYTKEKIKELSDEVVDKLNFLIIMNLNSQVRW